MAYSYTHTHTHTQIHTHTLAHTHKRSHSHTHSHTHTRTHIWQKKRGQGTGITNRIYSQQAQGTAMENNSIVLLHTSFTSMTKHLFLFMSLSRIHIYNTCIHIYVTLSLSIIIAVFTCHSFALMSSVISLFLCILLSASFRKKWFAIWFSVLTTFLLS